MGSALSVMRQTPTNRSALLLVATLMLGPALTMAFAQANPTPAETAAFANKPCRDGWLSIALINNLGPGRFDGAGDSGDCNPTLYNEGRWSSFAELSRAVRPSHDFFAGNGFKVVARGNETLLQVIDVARATALINQDGAGAVALSQGMLIGHDGASFAGATRHTMAAGEIAIKLPNGKMLYLRKK